MRLTRSGATLAAAAPVLLAAGLMAGYPELTVLGLAGIAALLLAAGRLPRGRSVVPVRREIHPARVHVGEVALCSITVENRGRRRSPPLIAMVAGLGRRLDIPRIAAEDHGTLTHPLPTGRRGAHHLGPVEIGCGDPFGLSRTTRTYEGRSTLWVHPRIHDLKGMYAGRARDTDGRESSWSLLGGAASHTVREYVPGDDWRLIHWASSARLGSLVVRRDALPDEPRLMAILDTSTAPYTDRSFEEAVSAVASLCVAAARRGEPLDLLTTSGRRLTMGHGPGRATGLTRALDLLAEVRRGDDPGLAGLPRIAAASMEATLCVVTGQPAFGLLPALAGVQRRFLATILVRLTHDPEQTQVPVPGVLSLSAGSAEAFAALWNRTVSP